MSEHEHEHEHKQVSTGDGADVDEQLPDDELRPQKQLEFDLVVDPKGITQVEMVNYTEEDIFDDPCKFRESSHSVVVAPPKNGTIIQQPQRTNIFGPLKFVDVKKCKNTAQLIEMLSQGISLNEYKLPEFIFRADILDVGMIVEAISTYNRTTTTTSFPPAQSRADGMQDIYAMLDAATVHLTYHEGYPAMPNGVPFWTKLDFEPDEAYEAFIQYLELGGARRISALQGFDLEEVREYFFLYYWDSRVVAFDMFRMIDHQRTKIQRMLITEDAHYQRAQRLLNKLDVYLNQAEFDEESLTPDRAIAMMEKLIKIQRISVGLSANGETKENTDVRKMVKPSELMRNVTGTEIVSADNVDDFDILTSDLESIEMAQELILRMNRAKPVNE